MECSSGCSRRRHCTVLWHRHRIISLIWELIIRRNFHPAFNDLKPWLEPGLAYRACPKFRGWFLKVLENKHLEYFFYIIHIRHAWFTTPGWTRNVCLNFEKRNSNTIVIAYVCNIRTMPKLQDSAAFFNG